MQVVRNKKKELRKFGINIQNFSAYCFSMAEFLHSHILKILNTFFLLNYFFFTLMNQIVQKTLLADLFYLLSGFDTHNIFITSNPFALNALTNQEALALFKPFEFLIFKIREFCAREEFDLFIKEYLEKLSRLKNSIKTFEELYVELQDDFETFQNLNKILEVFKALESNSDEQGTNNLLPSAKNIALFNNKNLISKINPAIIKRFQSQEAIELLFSINKWINQANPTTLIDITNPEGFNSCHWTNLFKIKPVDLPKRELIGIEETGKALFFSRVLFGIELVDDENFNNNLYEKSNTKTNSKNINMTSNQFEINQNSINEDISITYNSTISNKRKNNDISQYTKKLNVLNLESQKDIPDYMNNESDAIELNSSSNFNSPNVKRSPNYSFENFSNSYPFEPFYYKNDISIRRNLLFNTFSSIINLQIKREISMIEELVLLQNINLFNHVFESFRGQFFSDENIMNKINSLVNKYDENNKRLFSPIKIGNRVFNNGEFVTFSYCDSTLGKYVLKLLKFQQEPHSNPYLSNYQRIGIEFGSSSLIKYFVPEKTFIELKILFRFLFLVNSSIFYLQESKTFNFTRVIYLILLKTKEERIDLLSEFFVKRNDYSKETNCINKNLVNKTCNHSLDCNIPNNGKVTFINSNHNSSKHNNFADTQTVSQNLDGCSLEIASSSFSIDLFTPRFSTIITELMKKFYLTSIEVFPYWSSLLDIVFDFLSIEFKDCIVVSDFNQRVKACVLGLITSISRNHGENDFTEFLKNLEVEKYL